MTRTTKKPVSNISEESENSLKEESQITNGKEAANPTRASKNPPKAETKVNKDKKPVKTTNQKPKKSQGPPTSKTIIKKVPMTQYCSRTKELKLYRQATVSGDVGTFNELVIPLESLSEDVRQLVIKTAKLAVNYSKLHDPTIEPPVNDGHIGKSLHEKLLDSIKRVASIRVPDVPSEKGKEVTSGAE